MLADGDPIWVGVAAVIAALGAATTSVIGALNARTAKRVEGKIDNLNGHDKKGEA